MDFEILEHPADIGFRAYGATLPELFRNAALAMLAIADDPAGAVSANEYSLSADAGDVEALMVNWLNEVLFWYDGRRIAFHDFRIAGLDASRVDAVGLGEPRDPERHHARVIVKAVTWHQLQVAQASDGRWTAQIYLDI